MQTRITKIGKDQPEYIEIHCYRISDEVREIIAFVKSRQGQLTGTADERQYEIAVSDVFLLSRWITKPLSTQKTRCTKQDISCMSWSKYLKKSASSEFQNPPCSIL